jgi:hypothetical protein
MNQIWIPSKIAVCKNKIYSISMHFFNKTIALLYLLRWDSSWWTVHTGRAGNAMQSSSRWGAIKRSCRAYIHRVLHRVLSPAFWCTGTGGFVKMGQLPLPTVAVLKGGLLQEIRIWVCRRADRGIFLPQRTTVCRVGDRVLGYGIWGLLLHPQGCLQVDRLENLNRNG